MNRDDIFYRWPILSDEEMERLYSMNPKLSKNADYGCPTCEKNKGEAVNGEYFWKGEAVECDCLLQLQKHKHYLRAGIGLAYQRMSWSDFSGDREVVEAAINYIDDSEKFVRVGFGVILYGSNGTGKTLLIILMLKELIRRGYSCYFTTFTNMVEMYTAGWRSADEKKWFHKNIVESEILVLDDLGKELKRHNKLEESVFDSVLRQRVQQGYVTHLTTNLTIEELCNGYGKSIFSLFTERSIQLEVNGEDKREETRQKLLSEIRKNEIRPIF